MFLSWNAIWNEILSFNNLAKQIIVTNWVVIIYFFVIFYGLFKAITILRTKFSKKTVGYNRWRPVVQYSVYKVISNVCFKIVIKKVWEIKNKKGMTWTILPAINTFMYLWRLIWSVHAWIHYMLDKTWVW